MKRNGMLKIILAVCVVVIVAVIVYKCLPTRGIYAAPKTMDFYCIKETDFVKLRGNVLKERIHFYKDENMKNISGWENYDVNIHNNQWFENVQVAYCMNKSLAYPYCEPYNSSTTLLSEAGRSDEAGIANLLKNSCYREYWTRNQVSNLGAQIEATQIAIWIVTTGNGNTYSYPRDTSLWEGNTDKYSEDEVGGVRNMIKTLIECYENPDMDIAAPNISISTEEVYIENGKQVFTYNVNSGYCEENIQLILECTRDGEECTEDIHGLEMYIEDTLTDITNASYNCYEGNTRIIIKLDNILENRNVIIKLLASTITDSKAAKDIEYFKSEQTKDINNNGVYVKVQEMLGIITNNQNAGITFAQLEFVEPFGELIINKRDNEEAISGVIFGLYKDSDKLELIERLTTDEKGQISFKGIIGTTYYLCEEENGKYSDTLNILTKDGNAYHLGEVIPITFKQDGTVDVAGNIIDYQKVESLTETIYQSNINIYNHRQFALIEILKNGKVLTDYKNGEFVYEYSGLPGVTFGIYSDSQCNNLIQEIVTNEQGKATSTLLEPGMYYVKEISTLYGYMIDETVYKADVSTDRAEELTIREELSVLNDRININLNLKKVNEDNQPLEGAVFGIYSQEDIFDYRGNVLVKKDTLIQSVTTDSKGSATFLKTLPVTYSYRVIELKAPYGYVKSNEEWKINPKLDTVTESTYSEEYVFQNRKQTGSIDIYKTGNVLTGYKDGIFIYEYKPLQGIVFGIYEDEECTSLITKITTDVNGKCSATNLNHGTYYVKEISTVLGLVLSDEIHKIELTYTDPTATLRVEKLELKNEKTELEIELNKVDEGSKPLLGAEFGLYAGEDIKDCLGNILIIKDSLIQTITTDNYGQGQFANALPLGYSYYVKETKSPQGYLVNDKKWIISPVWKNSVVKKIVEKNTFVNTRQKGSISIKKTGELLTGFENGVFKYEYKPVKGVVFGIFSDLQCTNKVAELTTDEKGECSSEKLELGTYFVKELSTAYGLVLDETVHMAQLHYDKNVQVVTKHIDIKNERQRIELQIIKEDTFGKKLEGVVFGLYTAGDMPGIKKDTRIESGVSDKEGKITFDADLPYGKYYLKEEAGIKGYYEETTPIPIEIHYKDSSLKVLKISKSVENEPIIGSINASYNEEGDIKNIPESGGDIIEVPKTEDKTDMAIYMILALVAITIILAIGRKKIIKALLGIMVCIFLIITPVHGQEPETKQVVSEIFYNGEKQEFAKTLEDGKVYGLVEVKEIDLPPIKGRTYDATRVLKYTGYTGLSEEAKTIRVNINDPYTQITRVHTLYLDETVIDNTYWAEDFEFDIEVVVAPYIRVGDVLIEYNELNPGLLKYKEYFLEDMELGEDNYIIDDISWNGECYEENGVTFRKALATGRRKLNDYTLTYKATVPLPDITDAKRYVATYREIIVETAIPEKPATEYVEETKKEEVTTKAYIEMSHNTETMKTKVTDFSIIIKVLVYFVLSVFVVIVGLICYNIYSKYRKNKGVIQQCRKRKRLKKDC